MLLAPLCRFSVTSPTTHKQSRPFWCCFPSGWVCVRSRTLWVSPTNSPVRLGVSSAAASTPTGVFSQRFEALFPGTEILGCAVYLVPQWFFWVYLHGNVGPPSLKSTTLPVRQPQPCCESSPHRLRVSVPLTSLDEHFFFNSLVVGLPYSSIFWQFWLFFVFKFVVVLWVV